MSDEKKPFAWCRQVGDETVVEFDNGIVAARFGCDVASQAGYTADAINAAVERERREAAVKALRDKAAFIEFDAKATWDRAIEAAAKCKDHLQYHARVARRQGMFDAASILNEEAAKIERGEQ